MSRADMAMHECPTIQSVYRTAGELTGWLTWPLYQLNCMGEQPTLAQASVKSDELLPKDICVYRSFLFVHRLQH